MTDPSLPRRAEALIARLETDYDFTCEAGPLSMCVDWQALEAALRLSPPPETWRPISEDQFAHACQVALEYGTPAGHATLLDYMKSPRPAEGEEPRR